MYTMMNDTNRKALILDSTAPRHRAHTAQQLTAYKEVEVTFIYLFLGLLVRSHAHVFVSMYSWACFWVWTYSCVCVHACANVHVCMCLHMLACFYVCMHVCVHMPMPHHAVCLQMGRWFRSIVSPRQWNAHSFLMCLTGKLHLSCKECGGKVWSLSSLSCVS